MSFWTQNSKDALERQYDVLVFVVHLSSGVLAWELTKSFGIDLSVMRGKRGCRLGGILVYFPCRYISLVSVACQIGFICSFPYRILVNLSYVHQATAVVSLGYAHAVLAIRVTSIWRTPVVSYVMLLSQVGLCVVVCIGLTRVRGAWFHDGFQVVLAVYLMYLTTATPVLLFSGLLRARQRAILSSTVHEGGMVAIKKCCYFLYKEGLVELIFLWVLQMAVSVLNVLRFNPSGHLQSVLGYPAYIVTIACACRHYKRMVLRNNGCPVGCAPLITKMMPKAATSAKGNTRSCPLGCLPCIPSRHTRTADSDIELDTFVISSYPRSEQSSLEPPQASSSLVSSASSLRDLGENAP